MLGMEGVVAKKSPVLLKKCLFQILWASTLPKPCMTLTNVAFCNTAPCLNCIHRSYCGTDLMSNQKATKSAAGTLVWPARYNVFNAGKKEGVSDSFYFLCLGGAFCKGLQGYHAHLLSVL